MNIISAERRLQFINRLLEDKHVWLKKTSGVSDTVLGTLVADIKKLIDEKHLLTVKIGKAKALAHFDKNMTLLEAECYVDSINEMVSVNEKVAFCLSKSVVFGSVKASEVNIDELYRESDNMAASVFEMEERILEVKSNIEV